jgi:hypothetical protein
MILRSLALALCCCVAVAGSASAQHEHQHSQYADQATSGIASLSAEELEQLEAGAGMGMARAAELNHFPGPMHVLELADSLGLTADQRTQVASVRTAMLERAITLGEKIIEAERMLSMRFEHAHADSTNVETATAELGQLYGELRYVHLAAHLAVKQLLTEDQVGAYDRLRGYSSAP